MKHLFFIALAFIVASFNYRAEFEPVIIVHQNQDSCKKYQDSADVCNMFYRSLGVVVGKMLPGKQRDSIILEVKNWQNKSRYYQQRLLNCRKSK